MFADAKLCERDLLAQLLKPHPTAVKLRSLHVQGEELLRAEPCHRRPVARPQKPHQRVLPAAYVEQWMPLKLLLETLEWPWGHQSLQKWLKKPLEVVKQVAS